MDFQINLSNSLRGDLAFTTRDVEVLFNDLTMQRINKEQKPWYGLKHGALFVNCITDHNYLLSNKTWKVISKKGKSTGVMGIDCSLPMADGLELDDI